MEISLLSPMFTVGTRLSAFSRENVVFPSQPKEENNLQ